MPLSTVGYTMAIDFFFFPHTRYTPWQSLVWQTWIFNIWPISKSNSGLIPNWLLFNWPNAQEPDLKPTKSSSFLSGLFIIHEGSSGKIEPKYNGILDMNRTSLLGISFSFFGSSFLSSSFFSSFFGSSFLGSSFLGSSFFSSFLGSSFFGSSFFFSSFFSSFFGSFLIGLFLIYFSISFRVFL